MAELPDRLLHTSVWTDELVAGAGMPVVDMPFVAVGGGLGSFVMVDYLRIAGVPAGHIRTLTVLDHPWQNYGYLLASSQVSRDKRIRSDSSSTLDNIWGFPGYAVQESFGTRSVPGFVGPLWNVLTENVLCDYWTPKSGQVFRSMQREADRIDYWSTLAMGRAHVTRRRHGGGYFTVLTRPHGDDVVYRSSYVHLAVGYPGLAYLPDLMEYRARYGDSHRVVNAYELHEHVYGELNRREAPSSCGARASSPLRSSTGSSPIATGWAPTSRSSTSSGPTSRGRTDRRSSSAAGASTVGPTKGSTGRSRHGAAKTRTGGAGPRGGAREGAPDAGRHHHPPSAPLAQDARTGPAPGLLPHARGRGARRGARRGGRGRDPPSARGRGVETAELRSNFVIDATGLEADIAEHTLLADLLQHSGAQRNLLGRLDVEPHFEVRGSRAEPGRLYAVGAATLGGYLAGVDTFLGLQIAAPRDLRRPGPAGLLPLHRRPAVDRPVVEVDPRPEPGMTSTFFGRVQTLGWVALLGVVVWEPVFHLLQQFRWEKDWPAMFLLLQAVPEAVLVRIVLDRTLTTSAPIGVGSFAVHFVTTWLAIFLFVQGPMRVPFLRWRFRGGRIL